MVKQDDTTQKIVATPSQDGVGIQDAHAKTADTDNGTSKQEKKTLPECYSKAGVKTEIENNNLVKGPGNSQKEFWRDFFMRNGAQLLFIVAIVIITGIALCHYLHAEDHYHEMRQSIESMHSEFCNKYSPLNMAKDAKNGMVVMDARSVFLVKEEAKAIAAQLELQHAKIQGDFSTLTLWASVLMIVFLVFSIYSMWKIDDIQTRGRSMIAEMEKNADELNTKSIKNTYYNKEKIRWNNRNDK